MNEVTFTVIATMNQRWVNDFCSLLKWMEHCGSVGHSSFVGFYADGDGDFHPEFQIRIPFEQKEGIPEKEILRKPEIMFDAG